MLPFASFITQPATGQWSRPQACPSFVDGHARQPFLEARAVGVAAETVGRDHRRDAASKRCATPSTPPVGDRAARDREIAAHDRHDLDERGLGAGLEVREDAPRRGSGGAADRRPARAARAGTTTTATANTSATCSATVSISAGSTSPRGWIATSGSLNGGIGVERPGHGVNRARPSAIAPAKAARGRRVRIDPPGERDRSRSRDSWTARARHGGRTGPA